MLSINTIARVVVNTVRTSASPTSFNTGLLLVQENPFFDTHRLHSYGSAAEAAAGLTEMGFLTSSEAYKAVIKYFAASPAPSRLLFSCYPATENVSQALDAVLDQTAEFYGVMTCDSVAAGDYLTFAQHVESLSQPLMLFVPVTGTVANAIATNSTLNKLHGASIKRAVPFYCASYSDCAAVMGTAMGLELSHKGSAFALCYKTVQGMLPAAGTMKSCMWIRSRRICRTLQSPCWRRIRISCRRRMIPRPSLSTGSQGFSWAIPTGGSWPLPFGGALTSAR